MSTPIDVTCTLGNVRVTVDYTDDFKEAYSDYSVLLSSAFTSGSLDIKKGETRPAYMEVAKTGSELGVAIRLKKVTEETEKTYKIPTPLPVERRQNIRLIFKTDGEVLDGIGLEIVLDDEMTSVTLNEGIPDFMWKPFDAPKLFADDFASVEGNPIKISLFEGNPMVGFALPAGISSLKIKYWREGEEDNAHEYDLASDEGVVAAVADHFSWQAGGKYNYNLSGERKTGQLFLRDAITSLEAPSEENTIYTYHYEFSGVAATGKAQETNLLTLKAVVQSAGMPYISFGGFPESVIVEGDGLSDDVKAVFDAEGKIDPEKSTLAINDGTEDKIYSIIIDGERLKADWGISVESTNDTRAVITFPKNFSTALEAPETGSKVFTFRLALSDLQGKEHDPIEKTLTVKAPVFELTPSANGGDVFAKRAILRAQVSDGTHPDQLKFQWREAGADSWTDCKNFSYREVFICDTLKNLASATGYQVRAIYRENEKRVTNILNIQTEEEAALEDGTFENWHKKEVYKKTIWSIGTTGLGIDQWWPYAEGGSSWWATRNALTTSQRSGVSCYYTSYSGTIPVDNGYEGKAAEISTIGWGEGNTYTKSMFGVVINHKSAGKLFLGSHSAAPDGTETFDYGHIFTSRPDALEFYYKFKSLNEESFEVYIIVENRENGIVTELGRGRLTDNKDQLSFISSRININYTNMTLKATHLSVVFVSSNADAPAVDLSNGSKDALNGYSDSRYVGNVLTIDNVRLIYE